jgi:hypothetical protein
MSTLVAQTISNGTVSTSSENVIQGSGKAWVNFNGQGTVAIRASYNVSSITDNGSGLYTINFTNAFTDTNYAITSFIRRDNDSGSAAAYVVANQTQTKTTSALAIRTGYIDNGGGVGTTDFPEVGIAVFR